MRALVPPLLWCCDCSHAFSLACRAASATCSFCVPCLMGTVAMGWWLGLHIRSSCLLKVSSDSPGAVRAVGHEPAQDMRDIDCTKS